MNLDEEMRKLRESSTGELPAAQPRLDVDAVMARVRQEVARRKQARSATPMTAAVASDAGVAVPAIGIPALPRWSPAVPRLPYRSQYTLAELLAFADRDFVDQCYRILLRRSPDPGGLDHYLGRLRRGQLSKIEVLGEIRFSPEGMRHQVHVDGLLLPYTLHRWQRKPVLGPLLRWAHGLWRLGESSQRQQSLDVAHARELQEAGHLLNQAFDQIDTAWQALQLRQQQLEQQQEQRSHELAEANRKQGEALQARLDTAETGLQARLDAAESGLQARLDAAEAGLRTELAAIRTDLSRLAPLDALARVRDHTEANRKQGEALQARLDTAETGLQARLDAAETGLRTELAALRQALAPVTARVATTEQTSQRLEQELLRQVIRLEATHAAIRTELSRFAPLDALARVRDHTEANRKQGQALQARLDAAENGLRARLDAAETGLRTELAALRQALAPVTARVATTEQTSQRLEQELLRQVKRLEATHAAIRTDLSRLAPLDALARVRDHTEANRKQGEALQARLDTAETGLQARLDAAETGLRTELAALRQALAPVTARVATTEQTSQRLEQELLRQVKRLEATHAAIRTELSRFAPLDALARVRDHTEANRKQGQALQARLDAAENGLRARLDAAETELRTERTVLARALNEAVEPLRHQQVATAAFERRMLEDAERLERRLAALDAGMPPLLQRLDHGVARIDEQDARIRPLEAALAARHEEQSAQTESLDALYAAFEDRFRGSRELILRRIEPYLDDLREAGAGTREAPVLDLGCGRGEWLEMLRDAQMHARGIDLNRLFVEACRGRGFDVEHADAVLALRRLPESSIGAITSMHLVEHLPFETVIALLDEARRVLRPGGLLLLETPNPENIMVGACSFYTDPTHRNPIPPETLRWIVEARGFHGVRIERLTIGREQGWLAPVAADLPGAATINAMSEHLTAAPDYVVLGLRP